MLSHLDARFPLHEPVWPMYKLIATFIFFIIIQVPLTATCKTLASDTVWTGSVNITEDILVPEGVTLTILPGTVVTVIPAESTKTDPEFLSPLTEITIRGTLRAEGTDETPITFSVERSTDQWAGIIVDGGNASLKSCRVRDAETGVHVLAGFIEVIDSFLTNNRYGLIAQGSKAHVQIKNTKITENEFGILTLNGASVEQWSVNSQGNKKKDLFSAKVKEYLPERVYVVGAQETTRLYGDAVLTLDTVWQGRIEIDGTIRVPEGSRLIILPGSLVEIKRKNPGGGGIGENGLLIQGLLIAKGTKDHPIIFRSGEKTKQRGDWDSINIMNSDAAQNLIEYCQIEDAYRGLHFHFSNVAIKESVFRHNYRAVQFQESTAEITGNHIYDNKSGVQGRDSEITFERNIVSNNFSGINILRSTLVAKNNTIVNNEKEGLRVREGFPTVEANLIDGNRYGLLDADSLYGRFSGNVVTHNLETGILLKGTDAVEVSGNFVQDNGWTGIAIQDSRAVIRGNIISWNGERGIGITTSNGIITGNNFARNGRYAVIVEGTQDISAPMNWWGDADINRGIFDKKDDRTRGSVNYSPVSDNPIMFTWPLRAVPADSTWDGYVKVANTVTVPTGRTLVISPHTRVLFAKGAGLKVTGRILASGTRDGRIQFTSMQDKSAGAWDEILLDHATGSTFTYSDINYATWGIHSHFTDLVVNFCTFTENYGGIRFRSGPIEIHRTVFEKNSIGIRAFRGSAIISNNNITRNDIGIFVREKGGGLTIKNNNIDGNRDYGVRSGDFNDEDINATENWWGAGNAADAIFDGRNESGIGVVRYEPVSIEPYLSDDRPKQ
jgi:parallel beta-helix repeat protein